MTATVACVLRSGGDYDHGHVARLAMQVRANSPAGTPFICLTDVPEKVGLHCARRLAHDWPSWFSKIETFGVPGPILYLDLDVSIIGDLAPLLDLATSTDFAMLRDFWGMHPHGVNSSVMAWKGDVSHLYREFASAPSAHMSVYRTKDRWGDQAFVRDHHGDHIDLIQALLPGKVIFYKGEALPGGDLSDCRVLVSHGLPRPWDIGGADEWMSRRSAA